MRALAELLLALAVESMPPGQSPYSYEKILDCGSDPLQPACEIVPVCSELSPLCAPPKYSKPRGAWVRVESERHGRARYRRIAESLARVALQLTSCTSEEQHCVAADWDGDAEQLALSGLTVALHESGLREDIQFGYPPLGRGPQHEACLVQVMIDQAPKFAYWLTDERRSALLSDPQLQEEFAQSLLGDSPGALDRCFEIGLRVLIHARRACSMAHVPWEHGMFAMYGSGRTCRLPGVADKRKRTFAYLRRKALARKRRLSD